jgi:hypothetical protein
MPESARPFRAGPAALYGGWSAPTNIDSQALGKGTDS